MKSRKRNAVIVTILLFVCAAVYLNWSYNNRWADDADSAMAKAEDEAMKDANADYLSILTGEQTGDAAKEGSYSAISEYFATARLTRERSRDEAMALLQAAAAVENASQEAVDSAINDIAAMAEWTMKEAQLENMLLAKDFVDCVVFINGDKVTVAVPAPEEGLSAAEVARITEILTTGTDFTAANLNIVEVKD